MQKKIRKFEIEESVSPVNSRNNREGRYLIDIDQLYILGELPVRASENFEPRAKRIFKNE